MFNHLSDSFIVVCGVEDGDMEHDAIFDYCKN